MQPRTTSTTEFRRNDYVPTYNPRNSMLFEQNRDFGKSENNIGKWRRVCGYISILLIFVLLIIVVITICTAFDSRHNFLRLKTIKARSIPNTENKCNIRLVETIPEGLNYSINDPKFMSTYDAWNTLLDLTKNSLNIGSFYWTMRGVDVINHTTAAPGEAIFARLLSNKLNKNWNLRIAQNLANDQRPALDTILLENQGAANVRSVDFPKLLGGGVLHTKLWISDNQHFYLGSANMDWRSLTQVKELGVLAQNCGNMARDVLKIFEAYWYLGKNTTTIPNPWPEEYATLYNFKEPMSVEFNNKYKMSTYFSSSPPPFLGAGRTSDLDAIINTILTAKKFVHIAVMDYFPLLIYTKKMQYWPYIDDALRTAAVENEVSIKLLISWWVHSNPSEDYFLRSLTSLLHVMSGVDIEIKRFIVPADEDQAKIPYGRVNHNKYMVTDNKAYIGTSNWAGDYFVDTAGIGLVLIDPISTNTTTSAILNENINANLSITLKDELFSLFNRDWNSPYAVPLK